MINKDDKRKAYEEGGSSSINFLEKIKLIIIKPNDFLKIIKGEKGLKEPFLYYLVLYIFATLVSILTLNNLGSAAFVNTSSLNTSKDLYLSTAFDFITGIVSLFFFAYLTHLFARLFKGQGNYSDTFKASVYGATPMLIFGSVLSLILVFFLGHMMISIVAAFLILAVSLWSLWLEYKLLAYVHGIGEWRAFFAIILPIFIFSLITMTITFLFINPVPTPI